MSFCLLVLVSFCMVVILCCVSCFCILGLMFYRFFVVWLFMILNQFFVVSWNMLCGLLNFVVIFVCILLLLILMEQCRLVVFCMVDCVVWVMVFGLLFVILRKYLFQLIILSMMFGSVCSVVMIFVDVVLYVLWFIGRNIVLLGVLCVVILSGMLELILKVCVLYEVVDMIVCLEGLLCFLMIIGSLVSLGCFSIFIVVMN